jgi:hypothetical protein
MPIVVRDGGLRYFFYSNEGLPREPHHVHVKGCQDWLDPDVAIADSYGFNSAELARILHTVSDNRDLILRAWHEHFGN